MGGRSDGALQRAATLADGWLGLWVDEPRLRRSVELMAELADAECRPPPPAALVIPVAVTPDKRVADERLRRFVTMQYGGDLERFARWCIHGSPARIAEHLAAYVAAGASGFVLMPTAANPVDEIEGIAEIRTLLHG
jgi:alkanesulfonate monooxygenase SsuD/methylene tetrahydromethanopterin reductase-like flavin-dependent oxidoreductase (luciferase family)